MGNKISKIIFVLFATCFVLMVFLDETKNNTYAEDIIATITDTNEGLNTQVSTNSENNNATIVNQSSDSPIASTELQNNTSANINPEILTNTQTVNPEAVITTTDADTNANSTSDTSGESNVPSDEHIENNNTGSMATGTSSNTANNSDLSNLLLLGNHSSKDNGPKEGELTGISSTGEKDIPITIMEPSKDLFFSGNLINIDSIDSYNISGGNSTYCSMIAKLNLKNILSKQNINISDGIGSGLQISEGNAVTLINQGIKENKMIAMSGGFDNFSGTLRSMYNSYGSSIFDFYIYTDKFEDEYKGHRFIAFIASDKNIYVLDPIRGHKDTQPELMSDYINNINQNESNIYMYYYGFSLGFSDNTENMIKYKLNMINLMKLYASGDIIPQYDNNQIKNIYFSNSILFSNNQNDKILIDAGTTINEINNKPLNITSIGFEEHETGYTFTGIKKMDDVIDFGIAGQYLIFSKPVKISINTNLEEGSLVNIVVKHAGDEKFGMRGISNKPNVNCQNGLSDNEDNNVLVKNGKIEFWTCGASTFGVSYVGGATAANYVDVSFKNFTVNFVTGVSFPTGTLIGDVNLLIRRRPIDNESPTGPRGTTNCYPGEKSFQLTSPDGTLISLISPAQLTTPNTSCPETTTTFDDQTTNPAITNTYISGTYKPTAGNALSSFNNKSPFGTWTLRMTDSTAADGVILYGFTVIITDKAYTGSLCITSPANIFYTGTASSSPQIRNILTDYRQVNDLRGSSSGYYTTISISDLSGSNGIIPKSQIQRKGTSITTLSGTANPSVTLNPVMSSYHTATSVDTFIQRGSGTAANITGSYGSKLDMNINIPAYTSVGTYTGTITYTLYEN